MLKQRQVGMLFDVFVRAVGAGRFSAAAMPLVALPLAAALIVGSASVQSGLSADEAADLVASDEPWLLSAPFDGLPASTPTASIAAASSSHGGSAATNTPRAPHAAPRAPHAAPKVAHASVHVSSERPVRKLPRSSREQRNIAEFVAQKYRVALDDVLRIVDHAYHAARELRIDPYLVIAVMSIESSFNPNARSPQGAQGLMQVLTRVHADKFAPFGGVTAAFDPMANISVGSRILKEYLVRHGSVEAALKSYVGAALLPHDFGYGLKVLTERERIAAAAAGRPIPANLAVRVSTGAPAADTQAAASGAAPVASGAAPAAVSGAVSVPTAARIVPPISGEPSEPKTLPISLPSPPSADGSVIGAPAHDVTLLPEPVLPEFNFGVTALGA
ncbi:MAG: transglycosylase SLT domain-containing protein [Burkholderiaceae bacterium]